MASTAKKKICKLEDKVEELPQNATQGNRDRKYEKEVKK